MELNEPAVRYGDILLVAAPYLLWCAFWLFAVNWKRAWVVLGQGGWVPLVLLIVMTTFVWSRIAPVDCSCLRIVTIPNFWWQFGEVLLFVALAFFCGWLQDYFQLTPREVEVQPAQVSARTWTRFFPPLNPTGLARRKTAGALSAPAVSS